MANPFPLDKLPAPVRDGYTQSFQNKFTRILMDDGSSRVYRDYDSQPEKVSLTWQLNWEQLALFDAWVEYSLGGGVAWFDLALSSVLPTLTYKFLTSPVNTFDEERGIWVVTVDAYSIVPGPPVKPLSYFPTWPALLPEPEKSGYSYTVPDHVTFGNVAGGNPEARRRFVERITTYTARWLLTNDQYETFREFVNDELASGTAYFKAPFANGTGYGLVKGRFISPPVYGPSGACWEVTAQLETAEAPIMSRFSFESGGKLPLTDIFAMDDGVLIRTNIGLQLHDAFGLIDEISPLHQLYSDDTLSFAEQLKIKTGRGIPDNFAVVDQLSMAGLFTRTFQDSVSLSAAMTIKVKLSFQESFNLLDDFLLHSSLGQADQFGLDELISIKSLKTVDDEIELIDAGKVCWQDYAIDYFAENYVYTCQSMDS